MKAGGIERAARREDVSLGIREDLARVVTSEEVGRRIGPSPVRLEKTADRSRRNGGT